MNTFFRTLRLSAPIFLVAAILFVSPTVASAATCNSTGSGTLNWNTSGTWTCGHVPNSGDVVTISDGDTVSVNTAASAGTLIVNGTNTTSLNISGANSLHVFGNASISNGTAVTLAVGAGSLQIDGNLTLTGGSMSRTANLTIGTGTATVNGNVVMAGPLSSLQKIVFTGTGILNVAGSLDTDGTLTSSTGTVNFNGVGVQPVPAYGYNNLVLSGSGAKSLPSGTAIAGNLSIAPTGSATANIGAGLTINVTSLTLGGLGRINGTWGSTSSTATHTNNTYFAATTGKINVSSDTRTTPTVVTWPTASAISYTQALSASTLSGGVPPVAGSFAFTSPTTIPASAGTYSASVTFTPTDTTSYNSVVSNINVTVNKASSTTVVTCPASVTYNGAAQTPCTATVTGVGGLSLTPTPTHSSNTNAGTASASYTYAGDTNHTGSTDSKNFTINKATPTILVTPYSVTYDGSAHTATGSATGVLAESLSGLDLSGTTHTNAATYNNDPWAFTDVTGNYNNANGTVNDLISKANQTITFGALADKTYGDVDFPVTATSNSALTVSFGVSGNCSLTGNTVYITGAGSCTVTASQAGDTNYNAATSVPQSFTINKANALVSVNGYTGIYDSLAHGATGTATGVFAEDLSSELHLGSTFTNAPGGTASWTFDGDANYDATSGNVAITIGKAAATILVTPYDVTYDGSSHVAVGTAQGVLNESLSGLDLTGTTHTAAGTYATDAWVFTDVTGNYLDDAGTVNDNISKASAVISISPYSVTYDALPHTAVGTAAGVNLEDLSGLLTLTGTTHTNAGTYATDAWTFAGNANYNPENGIVSDSIAKADANITITDYSGVFDANAHGISGTATGVGAIDLTGDLNLGATYTNVSGGDVAWTFSDPTGNYADASGIGHVVITQANSTVTLVCPVSVQYNGAAQEPCTATVAGVGGLAGSVDVMYSANTDVGTVTATATFAGDTNHTGDTDSTTFEITQAPSTTVVTCPVSEVYTGFAIEPCSVSVSGIGGLALTPAPIYATNTNVGTASASYSFTGDLNHSASLDSKNFEITAAGSSVAVTCPALPQIYTGSAVEPCSASYSTDDGLSGSLSVTYGNNTNVGTATADATYAGDSNHAGSSNGSTFTISKADTTTIVTCPAGVQTYTGSAAVPPCTVVVTGANLSLTPDPDYADNVNVGTATASYTYAGDANHNGSSDSDTFSIGKANTTVSWTNPADITYGTALSSTQLNATASVVGTFTYTPAAGTVLNAGASQTLHVDFTPSDTLNYNSSNADVVINVNAADQTITFDPLVGKTYEDADFAVSATATSGLPVTFTVSGDCSIVGATIHITGAGSCTVTADQAGDTNFNAATPVDRSFSIDPKALTVTADAGQSKVFGASEPTLTYTPSEAVTFTGALHRAPGEDVNTYAIDQGDLDAGLNYSITFVPDTFAITVATADVTISDLAQIYDGSPKPVTVTTVPGSLAISVTYDGLATVPTDVGSYTVVATITDPNYNGIDTENLVISKATPVITWSDPADIELGTALGATQLDATTPVAGSFIYTPNAGTVLPVGANQGLHADFTPSDIANYETATADVSINVVDTTAPAVPVIDTHPTDPSNSLAFSFTFHDTEGGVTFECRVDADPYALCAGTFSGTTVDGDREFDVVAKDTFGNTSAPATFTWTVDTQGPTVAITNPGTTGAAGSIVYSTGDSASVACTLDGNVVTCTNAGPYAFSGLSDGQHTFVITGTDSLGNTGTDSVTWTVDAAGPDVTITAPLGGDVTTKDIDVTYDINGSTSVACTLDTAAYSCDLSGSVSLTDLSSGPHTFTVTGTDALSNAGPEASVTFTVDREVPTITLNGSSDVIIQVGTAYVDADAIAHDNIDADTLVITPDSVDFNMIGDYVLHYNYTDSHGNAALEVTRTVHVVAVPPVNQDPVLDVVAPQTVTVGDTVTFTANATDADLDVITYGLSGEPAGASVDSSTGAFTWDTTGVTPDTYTFDVTAADGQGGTDSTSVSITVNAVATPGNIAPVASNGSVSTTQDTSVGVTLVATDADVADILTYATTTNPLHGTLSGTGSSLTYTPNAGYTGPDSFTFKANDGTDDSNTATISITVDAIVPANNPPVATADSATTDENVAVIISVLTNDTDADSGDTLTVSNVGQGANGSVTTDGTTVTYTPHTGFSGNDSFPYTVSDGHGGTDTVMVTITVNFVDTEAPVITLLGSNPTTINVGETYSDLGATVTDDHDSNLGYMVSVDAGATTTPDHLVLDSSSAGTHTIFFSATDGAGNVGTTTRTVIVQTPVPAPVTPPSSNGGGGTPLNFVGFAAPTPGVVLGAATSTVPTGAPLCSTPLLTKYMRRGMQNDVSEVKKLQAFLNGEVHAGLPITGFFGPLTEAAVKAFQLKYASEVLTPWGITTPTGYVYKTTEWKINALQCSTLNAPMPQL